MQTKEAADISPEDLLGKRLSGILPEIDIAGHSFIVDWRLKELRAKDDFTKRIPLGNMATTDDGSHYVCFYNVLARTVVHVDQNIIRLPQNTVMLKIPNELALDPVAVARQYGQTDTFLLASYPIRPGLQAEVVPLSETALPQLVMENRKKLSRPQRHNKRRSKGKGL